VRAGSKFKYLRFIAGRHDLPFYYDGEVALQKSFLDAFLKGEDDFGWSVPDKVPPIDICLRKGNPGVNDPVAEQATFGRRRENEWPIERTVYTDFYLSDSCTLERVNPSTAACLSYEAPGLVQRQHSHTINTDYANRGSLTFYTAPFPDETEVTGHPSARLSVSLSGRDGSTPTDIDLFLTLRHIDSNDQESR
jgi:predicted acyl esterase